uniref:Uncharacterized protein n=1 Tax=Arundo donax TaxID=35708 RepID=A0A0A9AHQ7_ARUDO
MFCKAWATHRVRMNTHTKKKTLHLLFKSLIA